MTKRANRVEPKTLPFRMKRPAIYRKLTLQQQWNVIRLIDDYSYTIKQVATNLQLSYGSVRHLYLRYKTRGNSLVTWHNRAGRKHKPDNLRALQIILARPDLLQRWYSLTVLERCEEFRREFGINIKRSTLLYHYKKLGIRQRRPDKVYVLSRERDATLR
jgi:transposase